MKASAFIKQLKLANETHNVYVNGGFGVSLKGSQLTRYTTNNTYNKEHAEQIKKEAEKVPCFGFDCIGLVKAILWGWCADFSKTYGGAVYQSNGVADLSADAFFAKCTNKRKIADVTKIRAGEILHNSEPHVAVYIGDGVALESTRYGDSKIRLINIEGFPKQNKELPTRKFDEVGESPFITYDTKEEDYTKPDPVKTYLIFTRTGATHITNGNELSNTVKGIDEGEYPIFITHN